jgi:nucleoside-diphosphate-sugar epimerase|tara:strand:- start:241 stop:1557 length:1317 start_codon:yes stop_codon:yes gene_type:complete
MNIIIKSSIFIFYCLNLVNSYVINTEILNLKKSSKRVVEINKLQNIKARFSNNISRRDSIFLTSASYLLLPKISNCEEIKSDIKKVAVFGASGYTGGDTVRNLIEKDIEVLAITRRPVKIVNRENAGKDTLVIENIEKKNNLKSIIADVLKPETLTNILKDVDAVIYCAASKPKVTARPIPGVDLKNINYFNKKNYYNMNDIENKYVEESNHVEDIGLVNVANEVIKNKVKKLVIVSSICAKCQLKNKQEYGGEVTDKGETDCKACYDKQEGEERIKLMYEKIDNNDLSYTIVRPGLLTPGEKRGADEIEFNQGISKSGMISRIDLADILVSSCLTKNSNEKTFEVYYKDTAQPVDMFKSLKTCKDMGKSVKECFFGEGYDEKETISIDKLMKNKIKGSIFPSGNEILGNNYIEMLGKLKKDEKIEYDINILKSNDII